MDALDDVCEPPDENGIFYPGKPMPTVVHYCQFFIAGEMAFGKRRVPHDIFTCESPLLLEPSSALAEAGYKLGSNPPIFLLLRINLCIIKDACTYF